MEVKPSQEALCWWRKSRSDPEGRDVVSVPLQRLVVQEESSDGIEEAVETSSKHLAPRGSISIGR